MNTQTHLCIGSTEDLEVDDGFFEPYHNACVILVREDPNCDHAIRSVLSFGKSLPPSTTTEKDPETGSSPHHHPPTRAFTSPGRLQLIHQK